MFCDLCFNPQSSAPYEVTRKYFLWDLESSLKNIKSYSGIRRSSEYRVQDYLRSPLITWSRLFNCLQVFKVTCDYTVVIWKSPYTAFANQSFVLTFQSLKIRAAGNLLDTPKCRIGVWKGKVTWQLTDLRLVYRRAKGGLAKPELNS